MREIHTVEIGGVTRHLPLFEVAPGVQIAIFNMLGDTEIVQAAARVLAGRLREADGQVLVTAEAKSIPLAHELSARLDLPYVVLRKSYKSYMGEAISATTVSITTGREQTLYLDEKDQPLINGHKVIILDDVISTGSTLKGMVDVVTSAGGQVSEIAAVFTEGDTKREDVVALGNLPVFLNSDS